MTGLQTKIHHALTAYNKVGTQMENGRQLKTLSSFFSLVEVPHLTLELAVEIFYTGRPH